MKKINKIKDSAGQVAVEFILMFVLVSFIVIYIWNLSIGLAALQLREYATFMVGRAITAAYDTYQEKQNSAEAVLALYKGSEGFAQSAGTVSDLSCNINGSGNKGIYKNQGRVDWFTISDVGLACNMKLRTVIPLGGPLNVVSESLTWSEISGQHCKCALQFDKKWKDCLNESPPAGASYIDNGC